MHHHIYHIALCLAAGAFAVSCSQSDEPDSDSRYITFGVPSISLDVTQDNFASRGGRESRASLMSATDLTKFNVYGFCAPNNISGTGRDNEAAPNDWNIKNSFFRTGADIFVNQEVNVEGGFTNYTISNKTNKIEWHNNPQARYTFIAMYSSAGNFSMANASAETGKEHGPQLTFTLPLTGTDIATARDYKAQPDALLAATFNHQRADGNVPVNFFHIMMGLRFKFHNHSSKQLIITGMTFSGQFFRSVMYDFSSVNPTTKTDDATSNLYGATFTLKASSEAAQVIESESQDYVGGDTPVTLLLLPNTNATLDNTNDEYAIGHNKSIDIYYHFYDPNETDPEIIADNERQRHFTTKDNFRLNYIPDANTLHTAHFNFTGNDFIIYFQADNETNWENGSSSTAVIK